MAVKASPGAPSHGLAGLGPAVLAWLAVLARTGADRKGKDAHVLARPGEAVGAWIGSSWTGTASPGMARRGVSRQSRSGKSGLGAARNGSAARASRVRARLGKDRPGEALARIGGAVEERHGGDSTRPATNVADRTGEAVNAWIVEAGRGTDRRGASVTERIGTPGLGSARRGLAATERMGVARRELAPQGLAVRAGSGDAGHGRECLGSRGPARRCGESARPVTAVKACRGMPLNGKAPHGIERRTQSTEASRSTQGEAVELGSRTEADGRQQGRARHLRIAHDERAIASAEAAATGWSTSIVCTRVDSEGDAGGSRSAHSVVSIASVANNLAGASCAW